MSEAISPRRTRPLLSKPYRQLVSRSFSSSRSTDHGAHADGSSSVARPRRVDVNWGKRRSSRAARHHTAHTAPSECTPRKVPSCRFDRTGRMGWGDVAAYFSRTRPCETLAKCVGEIEDVPARYCAQRAEQPNHHPPVRRKIQPSLRRGRTWLARRQAASFASSAPTPCIAINPADASRERLDRVRPAPAETLER
jgi:hypothetical protein